MKTRGFFRARPPGSKTAGTSDGPEGAGAKDLLKADGAQGERKNARRLEKPKRQGHVPEMHANSNTPEYGQTHQQLHRQGLRVKRLRSRFEDSAPDPTRGPATAGRGTRAAAGGEPRDLVKNS